MWHIDDGLNLVMMPACVSDATVSGSVFAFYGFVQSLSYVCHSVWLDGFSLALFIVLFPFVKLWLTRVLRSLWPFQFSG